MLILSLLDNPLVLIAFLIAIIVGITVHEFAHAFTADQLGDDTPYLMGRVTLNPLAHIDAIGLICLFVIGFGWGKPVQINPSKIKSSGDEIIIALAGIFTNLLVATIFYLPLRFGLVETTSFWGVLLYMISLMNVTLAAFNLLPIPPLDGSHIIETFLPLAARQIYYRIGSYIFFGIIFLGILTNIPIISTVMNPIVSFFSLITTGNSSLTF